MEQHVNYQRVAKAIGYLREHFTEQPSLAQLASIVGLSPSHFQRTFSQWAGVSPKQFMQFLSAEYAKKLLREERLSLLEASAKTGFSGAGRLHDLFVKIEAMTPGEYKNGGRQLRINYSHASTLFGKIVVASTAKGICYLGFEDVEGQGLSDLRSRFPAASFCHTLDPLQQKLLTFFDHLSWPEEVRLHLQATDFQLKVWQALLTIPMGSLQSYGTIARRVDVPGASRAVGSAIGRNPVAVLIPCHRVIRASGEVGGYYWGDTRKSAIIGWEASKRETEHGSF